MRSTRLRCWRGDAVIERGGGVEDYERGAVDGAAYDLPGGAVGDG